MTSPAPVPAWSPLPAFAAPAAPPAVSPVAPGEDPSVALDAPWRVELAALPDLAPLIRTPAGSAAEASALADGILAQLADPASPVASAIAPLARAFAVRVLESTPDGWALLRSDLVAGGSP